MTTDPRTTSRHTSEENCILDLLGLTYPTETHVPLLFHVRGEEIKSRIPGESVQGTEKGLPRPPASSPTLSGKHLSHKDHAKQVSETRNTFQCLVVPELYIVKASILVEWYSRLEWRLFPPVRRARLLTSTPQPWPSMHVLRPKEVVFLRTRSS